MDYIKIKLFTQLKFISLVIALCCVETNVFAQEFIKGADISWQTKMIDEGMSWKNEWGYTASLHDILKTYDMDVVRLRVWVNPIDNYNNKYDVLTKALWADAAGMRLMIDFHYSDTWADPAHQDTPLSWDTTNVNSLMDSVWAHTVDVLSLLDQNNITPEWVQIGNETSDGMLWPLGKASVMGFQNYAWLVNTGHNATKSVFPNAKTIVHLANGHDWAVLKWNLDGLASYNATYDMIGLSLYPDDNYSVKVDLAISTLDSLINTYQKEVVYCEVGMRHNNNNQDIAYNALRDIINRTKHNGASGVLYWEPAGYGNYNGYDKQAWMLNKRPSYALNTFRDSDMWARSANTQAYENKTSLNVYPNPVIDYLTISNEEAKEVCVYDLSGHLKIKKRIENSRTISMSELTTGVYMLNIDLGDEVAKRVIFKK